MGILLDFVYTETVRVTVENVQELLPAACLLQLKGTAAAGSLGSFPVSAVSLPSRETVETGCRHPCTVPWHGRSGVTHSGKEPLNMPVFGSLETSVYTFPVFKKLEEEVMDALSHVMCIVALQGPDTNTAHRPRGRGWGPGG